MNLDCTTSAMKWLILLLRQLRGMNNSLLFCTREKTRETTYRIQKLRKLKRGKTARPQDIHQLDDRILLQFLQIIEVSLCSNTLLCQDLKVRMAESDACEKLHYRRGTVVARRLRGSSAGNLWLRGWCTRRRGCGCRAGMAGGYCLLLESHDTKRTCSETVRN